MATEGHLVADDARLDAVRDPLGAVRDGDLDALLPLSVHPLATGRQREVAVGDGGAVVGRIRRARREHEGGGGK